jgi:hypothetical protein
MFNKAFGFSWNAIWSAVCPANIPDELNVAAGLWYFFANKSSSSSQTEICTLFRLELPQF